jgi:hypothetical protein
MSRLQGRESNNKRTADLEGAIVNEWYFGGITDL